MGAIVGSVMTLGLLVLALRQQGNPVNSLLATSRNFGGSMKLCMLRLVY